MERFKLAPDHHEHDTGQDLDSGAACAAECTGLLHRAPESREEREAAEELARQTNSDVVQVIGSRFVLYRKKKKDPKIVLPR